METVHTSRLTGLLPALRMALAMLLLLVVSAVARAGDPGKIQILSVEGSVEVREGGAGKPTPAAPDQILTQKHRVFTGKDSRAILLFSNGSTITVGPDSTFSIDEFLQKPFDLAATDFRAIPAEPTTSNTSVFLNQTSLVGNIRKLKKGSSFDIVTPLGVAGIRGTCLQARSWVKAGRTYGAVAVVNGEVEVTTNAGKKITVKAGYEVILSAPSDDLKNVTAEPLAALTPEALAAIEATCKKARESIPEHAFQGETFPSDDDLPPPPPQAPIPGGNALGTQSSGGSGSQNQQPTPPPEPPPAS